MKYFLVVTLFFTSCSHDYQERRLINKFLKRDKEEMNQVYKMNPDLMYISDLFNLSVN